MPKSFLIKKAVNGKQESSQVDGCFETEKIDQSGYDNIGEYSSFLYEKFEGHKLRGRYFLLFVNPLSPLGLLGQVNSLTDELI